MSEEDLQSATTEEVVNDSAIVDETKTGEPDAPQVEETDEQKNERVQKEAQERSDKKARGIQKRMDELTADKYAERKRADDLAATNARILALLEGRNGASTKAESGEPNPEDYAGNDAGYWRAVAKYEASEAAKAVVNQQLKESSEQAKRQTEEQKEQQVAKEFVARRKEAEKSIPDYKDVVSDWTPSVPQSVQNMLIRLEDGPLIAYHLAKNPQLEEQFNEQPDYMHGVLLGQLLSTIKSTTKTTTNAPSPGKPVASKAGTSSEPPSDPKLYRAWADKNLR